MASGITFSGFNGIDFNTVITALMTQASAPLTALQNQQSAIQSQINTFGTLSTKISTLNTAAATLADAKAFSAYTGSTTDSTAVTVSTDADAVAGHYDVKVKELAHAQVTASTSSAPDAATTAVATGGSLTVNGVDVLVTGSQTLKQLAAAINGTAGVGVTASVVQASTGHYKLVLTGAATGADKAFTIANHLTGGAGVAFADTDGDGLSGNSAGDNAVSATDADITVNNVEAISGTNTFDSVIAGATLTVSKKAPDVVVGVDVVADASALKASTNTFISAYNDFVTFADNQANAASSGTASAIGRDPIMRQLRSQLRSALTAATGHGAIRYLSQLGVQLQQSGALKLTGAAFDDAVQNHAADMKALFSGPSGLFTTLGASLTAYTQTAGLLSSTTDRMTSEVKSFDTQIARMQNRLNQQRAALQVEFSAADSMMSTLKNQSGALTSVSNSLTSSSTGG